LLSSSNIASLLKPEVYPHPTFDLRLLETHISWVILTGDFAYKLKKPCKYSFVDYSSLELRRGFCLKELQYNRRLAADIYLDVVPIYELGDGAFRIGEAAEQYNCENTAIEYAVKMRQFPQQAILSSRVDHHELVPEAIHQFGQSLARFHESIELADPNLEYTQLNHIRQDANDNIQTLLASLPADSNLNPTLNDLQRWTQEEFALRASTFEKRRNSGFVRRCHGDMHLNNLIQLDGKIIAFDCIEFNEEFQWIDVMSDLAFPVMDFYAKGRADLSGILLNAYLETRDDWQGMEIFRFYAVYRALVRAKVTWLDPSKHISNQAGSVAHDTHPWELYFQTATQLAFPRPPRLAITMGLSGSGKSTRAMQYVSKRGALRIRSDIERNRMGETQQSHDRYSTQSRESTYQRLYELADWLLSLNYSVVVDATFLKRSMRHKFQALASRLQVPFDVLACEAPVEELKRRIANRQGDASEATQSVLLGQLSEIEPLSDEERLFVVSE
jgi:uncharacterized protein